MTDDDSGDGDGPDDLFDSLDADEYRDRRGDPFDALDDRPPDRSDPSAATGDRDDGDGRRNPTEPLDSDVASGDPMADLDVDEGPFESGSGAFQRVDVEAVDSDELWKRVVGDETAESAAVDPEEEVEVSKHTYCEMCEFFSPPPDVHCTHEGTDILEFVDMETVRVVNCPIVAERRRLGHED